MIKTLSDTQLLNIAKQYFNGVHFRLGRISKLSHFKSLQGAKVVLYTNMSNRPDFITINQLRSLK